MHSQETDLASKYTFGGKELQTELDLEWSDFGVRCFDAWSAKWQGVDILAEAKPFMSPYSYGLGNPIRFSDPSGMIEEDQDGLMSVSTDLWGGGRNASFMDQSAGAAKERARKTRDKQTGNDKKGVGLKIGGNDLAKKFPFLFGMGNYDAAEGSNLLGKIGGFLQALGGGLEIAAGSGVGFTGIGALFGISLAAHGFDNVQAGVRTLLSGKRSRTLTSFALQSAGLSESQAEYTDMALGFAGGFAGGIKSISTRGGYILSRTPTGGWKTRVFNIRGESARPTYGIFEWKHTLRIEAHPIRSSWPAWMHYPHWHADFLGKAASKWHLPILEPIGITRYYLYNKE